MDPDQLLTLVEAHLVSALGHDSGRASVSFLGTVAVVLLMIVLTLRMPVVRQTV